jgi:hypothetical protein
MLLQAPVISPARPDIRRQPPSRLAIVRAIPAGSRRARDQRRYLRAVGADPEIAAMRYERRRTVLELARVLARHADWHAMTSWRPRALACAEIGSSRDPSRPLSISAYKAARGVLEERGYLGLVSPGWTSWLSAAALDDASGTSAVFVLTVPRRKPVLTPAAAPPVNRPLADFRRKSGTGPRTREEKAGTANTASDRAARGLPHVPRMAGPWPTWRAPETRSEGLAAAGVVRNHARLLGRLSSEHWRSIARRFTAAGYSPGDLLHALDHGPDGRQHGWSADVRSVAGWARWRLSLWLDPQGHPVAPPSAARFAERERTRVEQAARRAERLRATERRADPAPYAAQVRADLQAMRQRTGDGRR